jgi:hypothetical protein
LPRDAESRSDFLGERHRLRRDEADRSPITAPIVDGMITSRIHVLMLVPVVFAIMEEQAS